MNTDRCEPTGRSWLLQGLTVLGCLQLVLAGLPGSASAGPLRIRIENVDLGTGVVVSDQGPGDLDPDPGVLVLAAGVGGGFDIDVAIATSQPSTPGSVGLEVLSIYTGSGATTLRITVEDDDFPGPPPAFDASAGGLFTAPAGSWLTYQSWANPDNLVPALGPEASPTGPLAPIGAMPAGSVPGFAGSGAVFGPGSFGQQGGADLHEAGLDYALFAQATITFTGPGALSLLGKHAAQVPGAVPVPGPAGPVTLGLALALLALYLRRRPPPGELRPTAPSAAVLALQGGDHRRPPQGHVEVAHPG
jgi:hypothetical protein